MMSEDELLTGLADAMTLGAWTWTHQRRSDLALTMGTTGVPDLLAIPPRDPRHLLAIEAKSARGYVTPEQTAWLLALRAAGGTVAVVRPVDYDRALRLILAGNATRLAWDWAFKVAP